MFLPQESPSSEHVTKAGNVLWDLGSRRADAAVAEPDNHVCWGEESIP